MTYNEQLQIQELNKNIINNILAKYTNAEVNEYYFNHTQKESLEYFGLRTIKQLVKLLKLTGYDFSQVKPTFRNCNKIENKRSHESYVMGGKKSAETQKQNWQARTDEEKAAWSNKMKESHSSEETRQLLSAINKKRYEGMSESAKRLLVQAKAAKERLTKLKNNSFNTSSPEDKYYNYLCEKYGTEDVVRQYSEDRYPFACDFYIKSLDLFIELNLTWTHGGKLFDNKNSADTEKLAVWKEKAKTSKYYQQAIYTWTDLDLRKMNTALENKLNYKVYYSEEEMYE